MIRIMYHSMGIKKELMIELKSVCKKWEKRKSILLKGMFKEIIKIVTKIVREFLKNIWIL